MPFFKRKLESTPSYSSEKSQYFDARSTHSHEGEHSVLPSTEKEKEKEILKEKHRSIDTSISDTATHVEPHPVHSTHTTHPPQEPSLKIDPNAAPPAKTDKPAPPILKLTDPQDDQQKHVDTPTVMSPMGQATPIATPSILSERHGRAATAESTMSDKAKQKLASLEEKEARRMSKMLESEQKEADKSLKSLIKELNHLQKVHKQAVRAESKAESKHGKAVKTEHKTKMALVHVQSAYEKAVANLKSRAEGLTAKKEHVGKQYTLLNRKTKEVEEIRSKKAVEDRERSSKLEALKPKTTGSTVAK